MSDAQASEAEKNVSLDLPCCSLAFHSVEKKHQIFFFLGRVLPLSVPRVYILPDTTLTAEDIRSRYGR
jgi:hypothetical protein